MTEKEPGRGKNERPVSNEKTAASERALRAPEDGSPRFVQTPSHITQSIRNAEVVCGPGRFQAAQPRFHSKFQK